MRSEKEIIEQIEKLETQIKNKVGNAYIIEKMIKILKGQNSSTYYEKYAEDEYNELYNAAMKCQMWLEGANVELYG